MSSTGWCPMVCSSAGCYTKMPQAETVDATDLVVSPAAGGQVGFCDDLHQDLRSS